MKRILNGSVLAALVALVVAACGGGGGGGATTPPPTPTSHAVDISWIASREKDVNTTGGGYIVNVSGQTPISVPYVSGVAAPTTVSTTLMSGSYNVTVRAYSALNPTGNVSAAYSFSVPY